VEQSGVITGESYSLFKRGDTIEAGVLPKPDDVPASMWLIYVRVADIEAACADVTRLGGSTWGPVINIPTIGRFSWAVDPTGAAFGMHEKA
jgi:predicted enzyme related to lactoylglutathione lyase